MMSLSMVSFCILVLLFIIVYSAFLSLSLSTPAASENQTDALALLAFKSQLTKSSQKTLSSWNDSLHVCDWEGVSCDRLQNRVTKLDLRTKGLEGTITPYVGNLSFLSWLELSNNSFHGNIPPQIGKLSKLEVLGLNNNSLVGEIPVNISLCSNLVDFHATLNNLLGKLPTELGSLSKLMVLALDYNGLSGELPSSLGNLTSLESLSLDENSYNGSIPNTLHQLKHLQTLNLHSCGLSGWFPSSIFNLSALENISIGNNSISGNLPNEIGSKLPNLKRLSIWGNKFSGRIPSSLFNISGLQRIDIGGNNFTGEIPLSVGNLQNLRVLGLFDNDLGSGTSGDLDFITSLTNCSNLWFLSIGSNKFRGLLPPSIANFSNKLYLFDLADNQISGNFPSGILNAKGLRFLSLGANLITGSIPSDIGDLQNLESLSISKNQLSGHIPLSVSNMSRLLDLDLSYNNLEGGIFAALDNRNLEILDLSFNKLIGNIPSQDMGSYLNLTDFIISHNSVDGPLPSEVGNLNSLIVLDVSHNKMSGEIPSTLGNCSSLSSLSFRDNRFDGHIPSSLSSLRGLEDIDLSNNNISGVIPKELQKMSALTFLNLSFNNLEGEVPVHGIFGNATAFSVVGNRKVCGGISKLDLPKCQSVIVKDYAPGRRKRVILIASIASFAGVISLAFGIIFIWKKRCSLGGTRTDDLELPLYDLSIITTATNNFSTENKLGEGGFGPVYKGNIDGKENIAVKRLSKDSVQGTNEFMNEVILLSKLQHKNLVKIFGCCIQREEKMLVYEYVQNNSLDSYIFDDTKRQLLDWETRFEIILGIARGLLYLHHDSRLRIIHRDLKAGNILLDHEMGPKISDFGMARIFRVDDLEVRTKRVVGTHGYMSPEYMLEGLFSMKSDVFSFGVIVLEIISGKRNIGYIHSDYLNLLGHAWRLWSEKKSIELLDESIRNSYNVEDVLRCIHVGLLCVQRSYEKRPTMSSVVMMLSTENAVLSVPDQPGFYVGRGAPSDDISCNSHMEPLFSCDADITLLYPR